MGVLKANSKKAEVKKVEKSNKPSRKAIKESNIVPEHAKQISKTAQMNNEIIMVRPVNKYAKKNIRNNCPTKDMRIKGKTAYPPPKEIGGFIPVDQKYSKLGNQLAKTKDPKRKEALEKEIKEKNELNLEIKKTEDDIITQKIQISNPPPDSIEVLADPGPPQKPYTADYDLFAVGFEEKDRVKKSKDILVTDERIKNKWGTITYNELGTSDEINESIKKNTKYSGGNMIHHGPESQFEKSTGPGVDKNNPITIFTPDGNVKIIKDETELKSFYKRQKSKGYKMPKNSRWAGWENI